MAQECGSCLTCSATGTRLDASSPTPIRRINRREGLLAGGPIQGVAPEGAAARYISWGVLFAGPAIQIFFESNTRGDAPPRALRRSQSSRGRTTQRRPAPSHGRWHLLHVRVSARQPRACQRFVFRRACIANLPRDGFGEIRLPLRTGLYRGRG